ncbi:hypothetical protein RBWH47_05088 [Rhodopirellula baltica WH47]|uniref:Uncharacterized protein n=1 Tax=Rhodopirellula baltica WH47 TaxID=991778 RepID=F2AWI3_RHOBT|nr:hypothetical protein RBWH47_05088 [Rhodopirellula baltica WH47]
MSERRACREIGFLQSSTRYLHRTISDEEAIPKRLDELNQRQS